MVRGNLILEKRRKKKHLEHAPPTNQEFPLFSSVVYKEEEERELVASGFDFRVNRHSSLTSSPCLRHPAVILTLHSLPAPFKMRERMLEVGGASETSIPRVLQQVFENRTTFPIKMLFNHPINSRSQWCYST